MTARRPGGADLAGAGHLGCRRAEAVRAVVPGVPAGLAVRAIPRDAGEGAVERVRAQPAPAGLGPAVAPARASGGVRIPRAAGRRGNVPGSRRADNIYRQKFEAYYGRQVTTGLRPAAGARQRRGDGGRRLRGQHESLFPVFLATAVLAVGWAAVLWDTRFLTAPVGIWDVLKYGFLGAYAFVTSMLIRRFFQSDLRPSAYATAVLPDRAGAAHRRRAAPGAGAVATGRSPSGPSSPSPSSSASSRWSACRCCSGWCPGFRVVVPPLSPRSTRSTSSTGSTSGTRRG